MQKSETHNRKMTYISFSCSQRYVTLFDEIKKKKRIAGKMDKFNGNLQKINNHR